MASRALPPSPVELNLLLEWRDRRSGRQWVSVLAVSVVLHFLVFLAAVKVPSLLGQRQSEARVVLHRIPLYLPPDLMTQKAQNREKISKDINLADFREKAAESRAHPGGPRPSVRRFEVPKEVPVRQLAQNIPVKILPQAPALETAQNPSPSTGAPGGLPIAPPPAPRPHEEPFQNVGSAVPPNPHPTLAPPKASVSAAIGELAQNPNSRNLAISDDVPERVTPGSTGLLGQAPAQHAAVELQSDPSGADFKEYLKTILTIVRANWRRVIPESARMGALRGRTVVQFIIYRDGSIPKLVVADTSGAEPLDRAAVAGLSMSNPLPPLPADFKGLQVRLAFTFAYNTPTR